MDVLGRECDRVTCRSDSISATVLLFIEVPRSACRVSVSGSIPCLMIDSCRNRRASSPSSARAIIVVAGMDGALPGLVAGLVSAPVIAVPTSVGYGAALQGLAALLTMLNSCAPGVAVVNIDNGYGAGHLAAQIAAPA